MKVLIVDDNVDISESTKMFLQMEGHDVKTVLDARQALAAMHTFAPDVVLQDITMPDLDLEAHMRTIREDPELRDTRILLFTANMANQDQWRAWGADGFVPKPFGLDELLAAMQG